MRKSGAVDVRFSNRPFRVKRFQTFHHHCHPRAREWNFQLLGARIGARAFLVAPYTAEPELLDMADRAMLAGNVSLYGVDLVTGQVDGIRLETSAIVANSCVLLGGALLSEFSLLGDLSAAGRANAIPPGAIAVGVPPRVAGRTQFRSDPDWATGSILEISPF